MNIKKFILLVFVGAIAETALSPLRIIGYGTSCVGGFVFLFSLEYFVLTRYGKSGSAELTFWSIFLGVLLIQLPIRIVHFNSTLFTLPDFICHLLGVLIGYVVFKAKGIFRWTIPIVILSLVLFTALKGYEYWLNVINFGSYNGHIRASIPTPITGSDDNGQYLNVSSMKGKVVVLDFWFTRCGACFDKFPALQVLYDKYKANPGFQLYAVNEPIESDTTGQAKFMLRKIDYSFPILILSDQQLPKTLGVRVFPTVIVIDQNQNMVFRGDLQGAYPVITKLLGS